VRFSTTVRVVFRGGGIIFLLPPPFSSSPSSVFYFLLSFFCHLLIFCSILLRQRCCCSGLLASFPFWPFTARRSSPSMKQPGSTLVFRWILLKIRSTYLKSTRAYTHHSTVITGLSALHRHLAIRRLHCTRRDVSSTRLRVDLTRRRVSPTLRAAAPFCNSLPWTVPPSGRSSTLFTVTAGCLAFCCISACIFIYMFSCNFLLFFVGFIFLLFCLGFSLLVLWLIFEVETLAPLWFFAVPVLQLSLLSGGCFTRIELFTEFLCNLHRLVRLWNRPGLLIVLFELSVITIACCSVLLDRIQNLFLYLYCILSFGFIVGEPTPVSFFRMSHFFFLSDQKWE
jgi:hypothetical protein